jgi:hypothetical protein
VSGILRRAKRQILSANYVPPLGHIFFGGLGGASHFGRSVSQSKRLKIDDFTGLVLFLFVSLMGELAALAHPGNVPLRRELARGGRPKVLKIGREQVDAS